jgi:autotransporter-associated beta strand protein
VRITNDTDVSFNGIVANNGANATSFIKGGTGRLTLAEGFNCTATGGFGIGNGIVRLGTTSNLPSAIDLSGTGSVVELAAGNVSRLFSNFAGNRFRLTNAAANMGFAAIGADRTLTMANTGDVTWGVAGDGFLVSQLILGTADSTGKLTFTHQNVGTGKGLRLQTGTVGTVERTIRVDNGTAAIDAEITMPLMNGSTAGHLGALTKQGLGVLKLSDSNTYSGATSVSQGVLLIDGSTAASSAVSVASGAAIGGNGTINGNLTLDSGALFAFDTGSTLDLGGSFSLDSLFGVDDLVSTSGGAVDWANIAQGTYTLMNTSFTFNDTNIGNFGTANQATGLAGGKSAYFQQGSPTSSLQLVVVPEPATIALAAVGVATLAWTYRRRKAV